MPNSDTVQVHRERILRVLRHPQEHLDRDLSIDELANVASLSEFHAIEPWELHTHVPIESRLARPQAA